MAACAPIPDPQFQVRAMVGWAMSEFPMTDGLTGTLVASGSGIDPESPEA